MCAKIKKHLIWRKQKKKINASLKKTIINIAENGHTIKSRPKLSQKNTLKMILTGN